MNYKKMSYEEMSDFEINKLIAFKLYKGCQVELSKGSIINCCVTLNGSFKFSDVLLSSFNPCNNPSDAWPIILESGICLTSPTKGRKSSSWSASWNYDGGRWSVGDIVFGHTNPLRAAMIVFLMMKEGES